MLTKTLVKRQISIRVEFGVIIVVHNVCSRDDKTKFFLMTEKTCSVLGHNTPNEQS